MPPAEAEAIYYQQLTVCPSGMTHTKEPPEFSGAVHFRMELISLPGFTPELQGVYLRQRMTDGYAHTAMC